jgi:hypothetical protein
LVNEPQQFGGQFLSAWSKAWRPADALLSLSVSFIIGTFRIETARLVGAAEAILSQFPALTPILSERHALAASS